MSYNSVCYHVCPQKKWSRTAVTLSLIDLMEFEITIRYLRFAGWNDTERTQWAAKCFYIFCDIMLFKNGLSQQNQSVCLKSKNYLPSCNIKAPCSQFCVKSHSSSCIIPQHPHPTTKLLCVTSAQSGKRRCRHCQDERAAETACGHQKWHFTMRSEENTSLTHDKLTFDSQRNPCLHLGKALKPVNFKKKKVESIYHAFKAYFKRIEKMYSAL